ncbi:unnamed protein product, partial [Discosporangium mesarthrocarpum]
SFSCCCWSFQLLSRFRFPTENARPMEQSLVVLCLLTVKEALEKGASTGPEVDLTCAPLGLCELIFEYVFSFSRPPGATDLLGKRSLLRALQPHISAGVRSIDLSGVGAALSDDALREIAHSCSRGHLEEINLSGCLGVSDKGVGSLANSCRFLTSLSLSSCPLLTNKMTFDLGRYLTSLTSLSLAGAPRITGSGAAYLVASLPNLERLSFARCSLVGDEVLLALSPARNSHGPSETACDKAVDNSASGCSIGGTLGCASFNTDTEAQCRARLCYLDLSGTAVSEAGVLSGLGGSGGKCSDNYRVLSPPRLEFLSLSATGVGKRLTASLAREANMPATLPDAPKTMARSNRALLEGLKWAKPWLSDTVAPVPRGTSSRRRKMSTPCTVSLPPTPAKVELRCWPGEGESGEPEGEGRGVLALAIEAMVAVWGHPPNPPTFLGVGSSPRSEHTMMASWGVNPTRADTFAAVGGAPSPMLSPVNGQHGVAVGSVAEGG